MARGTGRTFAWLLLACWAGVYGWSLAGMFWLVDPQAQGWDHGLNRLTTFLGWQAAAGVLAILLAGLARRFHDRFFARWLMRLPLLLAFCLVVFIVGVILAANLGLLPGSAPPPPGAAPPAVPTAPAD